MENPPEFLAKNTSNYYAEALHVKPVTVIFELTPETTIDPRVVEDLGHLASWYARNKEPHQPAWSEIQGRLVQYLQHVYTK